MIALPAAGLGMTLGAKDKKGLIQYSISLGASTATVHLLKNTNDKYRPDASNTKSYPSGHTQAAFFGAGYIWQRYGAKWGIPAFVAAGFTGWSRVAGQKHFSDDVISGASIAMLYNWLIVKPADPERAAWQADMTRERKYRFEWETVDATVSKNLVRAPSETGTEIDFRFDENANPTMTAAISFDLKLNRHHSILFRFAPFEQRDVGTFEEDSVFGDIEFEAGDDVYSIYFQSDFRARWAYELLPDSPFILQLGGGLTIFEASAELYPIDLDEENPEPDYDNGEKVRGRGIAPVLYAKLGGRPSKKTEIFVVGDGFSLDGESWLDVAAKFVYRFNPKWEIAAGWRTTSSEVEIEEIFNRFDADGFLLHFGYSF